MRSLLSIFLALLLIAPGVASAATFRYTLEHEGRAVGTVRYERVDAGDRIRTSESISVSMQTSTGALWAVQYSLGSSPGKKYSYRMREPLGS